MDKTKSMSRNQNHDYDDDDDASSMERIKTCDKDVVVPWSDLDHDVLYLVMMCLGVVDFVAFKGVCKSWRTFALSNRKKFMASRPPMSISISTTYANEKMWYLKDFDGRMFKTIIPQSVGRKCVGLTCGYLVLFGRETKDFWLVNPITSHQLYFPKFLQHVDRDILDIKAILVFSPSISDWVIVVVNRILHIPCCDIWFCVAGKGAWNHVISPHDVVDLHAFKGKIYTLDPCRCICELRLNPVPKLTWVKKEYSRKPPNPPPNFASSGENHYVTDNHQSDPYVCELDFDKMKWATPKENTGFFFSDSQHGVAFKPESWSQYMGYNCFYNNTDKYRKGRFFTKSMWYFPHLCLDVDILDG